MRIVGGKDPKREELFHQLEALAGERMDRQTREAFDQLSYLKQQEAMQAIKKLERQRTLSESQAFRKGSLADRKLTIEQQARHADKIRRLIATMGLSAAGAAGAGAVAGIGTAAYKAFTD